LKTGSELTLKTRSELEQDVAELRAALMLIEQGYGPADVLARAALMKLMEDGGRRKWETLVQVRENNNTVPGAMTISARRRWKR
jgi:hypothetical protein